MIFFYQAPWYWDLPLPWEVVEQTTPIYDALLLAVLRA